MSTWLLSVDPGLRACGCALWEGTHLRAAALVESTRRGYTPGKLADDVDAMVVQVLGWFLEHSPIYGRGEVVVEMQRTYGGQASKGATDDLLGIALVSGGIIVWVRERTLASGARLVLPQEWKGGTPKETKDGINLVEYRARGVLDEQGTLSRVKLPRAKSLQHNVWDAVGIGLWALGRARWR